ncbi:hypothetical protein Dimus_029882 [Dionaea muscipula]
MRCDTNCYYSFFSSMSAWLMQCLLYIVSMQSYSFVLSVLFFWVNLVLQQEEGWPLGLQRQNVRSAEQLVRNRDISASLVSLRTIVSTVSPSTFSSPSSSDLDTESSGSFFQDRSMSLGCLIGMSTTVQVRQVSTKGNEPGPTKLKGHKSINRSLDWLFALCMKPASDDHRRMKSNHSLGFLIEEEKRRSRNAISS